MRKEKEIKELEARLAFLNPVSSDDEHRRLLQIYETEKITLNNLYRDQRQAEDTLAQSRHKVEILTDNKQNLELRIWTVEEEISEIELRYSELKPPPKVGYVIEYTPTKEEQKVQTMGQRRSSSKGEAIKIKVTLKDPRSIPGLDYYHPTPYEF